MQTTFTPRPGRLPDRRLILAAVVIVLVVAAAVTGYLLWKQAQPVFEPGPYHIQRAPRSAAIEERFGIRILYVGLTARDGLVDVRYRVMDADRARDFGHYTETSPILINERSGEQLTVTKHGLHNHRVQPGLIFAVQFRNTGNALLLGDKVTLQVGDMQLAHIAVQ